MSGTQSGRTWAGHGFSLIELLIVVLMIAVLAIICVPNYLEARVRSKVSRVQSDFRTIGKALEIYRVGSTQYPLNYHNNPMFWNPPGPNRIDDSKYWSSGSATVNASFILEQLTTPVAYLTSSHFEDPFGSFISNGGIAGVPTNTYWFAASPSNQPLYWRTLEHSCWCLRTNGPDHIESWQPHPDAARRQKAGDPHPYWWCPYDPSNGTVSEGDVLKYGPDGCDD